MIIYLVELKPALASTGAEQTLRFSSNPIWTRANGVDWLPMLAVPYRRNTQIFDGSFQNVPRDYGQLEIARSKGQSTSLLTDMVWDGRPVKIWKGEAGQNTAAMTVVFDGVAESVAGNRGRVVVTLKGPNITTPVLTTAYAGTGGSEGPADLKDTFKPMLLGTATNLEPIYINRSLGIFQYHAYGAAGGVSAVYDSGSQLGTSIGDYASYAALAGAAIPAGRFATCNALGMGRHGGDITGILTIDAAGITAGSSYPGALMKWLLRTHLGLSATKVKEDSLDWLDVQLPYAQDNYVTEQINADDLCNDLMLSLGGYTWFTDDGKFTPGLVRKTGASIANIDRQNIGKVEVKATGSPVWKRQMGWQRSWRVHSYSEVRTPKEINPRGVWSASPTPVYQYYDKVEWINASWIYIASVAGNTAAPGSDPAVWALFTTNGAAIVDQTTTPSNPVPGMLWRNSTNGELRSYIGGSWLLVSTIGATVGTNTFGLSGELLGGAELLNTNQLWSQVGGANRPADNATRNIITRSTTAPASPLDGDVWVDTSVSPNTIKVRVTGAWQISSNLVLQGSDIGVENGATSSDNLIRNGNLFDGTNFWYINPSIAANVTRTAGVTGDAVPFYFRCTGTTDVRANNAQLFGVQGGSTLFISAAVRSSNFSTITITVTVWEYDAAGGLLAATPANFASSASNVWQTAAAKFVLQPTTSKVQIILGRIGSGGTADIGNIRVSPTELSSTKNVLTYSGTAPSNPTNGDIWVDTSVTPNTVKMRISGAWQTTSNLTTNTNQLTDGAGLGTTATWNGVTGTGRPVDNATNDHRLTSIGSTAVTIVGNSFVRNSGSGDYNACVRSEPQLNTIWAEVDTKLTGNTLLALDDDATSTAYASMAIQVQYSAGGTTVIYMNGGAVWSGNLSAYAGKKLAISYDGARYRVYIDGNIPSGAVFNAPAGLKHWAKWHYYDAAGAYHTGLGSAASNNAYWGDIGGVTQLLFGPSNVTNLSASYTVGGSDVTINLPSHTRSIAGPAGAVTLSYGAMSGTVAFSTYWTAYVDDPYLQGIASPTAVFTSAPVDLLYFGRYQVSSGVTPAAGGSGGAPPGGGGGGGGGFEGCVEFGSWMPDGRKAGSLKKGDQILILDDEDRTKMKWGVVQGNKPILQDCYEIASASGIRLRLSSTTPCTLFDGSVVFPDALLGKELAVLDGDGFRWEEIVEARPCGQLIVARISCNEGTYAAGDQQGRYIFTHNVYYKP